MEAQRTPFRRGFSTLQTSLTLPELPCTATAGMVGEDSLRFEGGGCRAGKFLVDWEVRWFCRVRLRARFVGWVRRESVCLSQVQIDPPSSVAYAPASPQGEAFAPLSFFTTGRASGNSEAWLLLDFCLLPEIVFTMFARAYKRLPLGGKKTASSLSRKRLMRGDKSAFPIEIYRSVPINN